MKNRHSKRPARRPSGLKAHLLSATALVAAGAFIAQPAWAADREYTTAGPHTEAIVVDAVYERMYATAGVVATFGGTVTYTGVGSSFLEIGLAGNPIASTFVV